MPAGRYRVVDDTPSRLAITARRSQIAVWVTVLVLVQLLVMAWLLTPASRFRCQRGGDCEIARWNFAPIIVHREAFPASELRGARLEVTPAEDPDDAPDEAIKIARASGPEVVLDSNLDRAGKQAWVDAIAKFVAGGTPDVTVQSGSIWVALGFVGLVFAGVGILATRGRWRLTIDRTAKTLAIANNVGKTAKERFDLAEIARVELVESRDADGELHTRAQLVFVDGREVVPITEANTHSRRDHEALVALVAPALQSAST